MNSRKLKIGPSRQTRYTRKFLTSRHLKYLRRWQHRLKLDHCNFVLRVKPASRRVPLASVQDVPECKHLYVIWLTPATLRDTRDWHDSIIHELLHVAMWELDVPQKEHKVEQLICILANNLSR